VALEKLTQSRYDAIVLDDQIEEAAAIGMTIEELVQLGTKRRGRPPKDKEED
jgi:hypothetical protein